MKKKEPKLVSIDLSKGNGHTHPDICLGKRYLAKIGGEFYTGRFSKQWYGFNFNDGWGGSGHHLIHQDQIVLIGKNFMRLFQNEYICS